MVTPSGTPAAGSKAFGNRVTVCAGPLLSTPLEVGATHLIGGLAPTQRSGQARLPDGQAHRDELSVNLSGIAAPTVVVGNPRRPRTLGASAKL